MRSAWRSRRRSCRNELAEGRDAPPDDTPPDDTPPDDAPPDDQWVLCATRAGEGGLAGEPVPCTLYPVPSCGERAALGEAGRVATREDGSDDDDRTDRPELLSERPELFQWGCRRGEGGFECE